MKYLQDESLDKRKKPFDRSGWQIENVQVCHVATYFTFLCSVLFYESLERIQGCGSSGALQY
jgi:hypothetical protein